MSKQAPPTLLTMTKNLPCQLTDEEQRERGIELARTNEDYASEEKRQADIKAELKAQLAGIEARRTSLASIVRRKEEYRDVKVEEHYDYQRGVVVQVRTDTGEQIMRREMTEAERQAKLNFEEDGK